MKRLLIVFPLLSLVACVDAEALRKEQADKVREEISKIKRINTWKDPDTGCVYFLDKRSHEYAMSPRFRRDGTPDCPDSKPLNQKKVY